MATIAVRVRPKTATKLKAYGRQRRLKLVEVVDVAINALTSLPPDQQERFINNAPPPAPLQPSN